MKKLIASGFLGGLLAIIGLSLMAPRDGNGTYSLPAGNPIVTGTPISSSWANTTLSDLATSMTNSIAKDGQTVPTADLPMGGYKHTGIGNAAARNQYASAAQIQDGALIKLGSVTGTNTITGSLSPAITSYSAGTLITFTPANNNTGATTLALNGLTALDVQKGSGSALASGDLVAGVPAFLILDTGADDWILINPQGVLPAASGANLTALNADNVSSGTLAVARGGTGTTTSTGSGNVVLSASPTLTGTVTAATINATTLTGNGSGLTNLEAGDIASGTLAVARGGTGVTSSTGSGNVVLSASPTLTGTVTAATINATTITGNGSGLTNLDAGDIASGTLPIARGGTGNTGGVARNISSKSGTAKTLSTSAPSGGSDGDIWYRY